MYITSESVIKWIKTYLSTVDVTPTVTDFHITVAVLSFASVSIVRLIGQVISGYSTSVKKIERRCMYQLTKRA